MDIILFIAFSFLELSIVGAADVGVKCTNVQVCEHCRGDYTKAVDSGRIHEEDCLYNKSLQYSSVHWYPGTATYPQCRYFDDPNNVLYDNFPGRWQAWPTCETDCLWFTLHQHFSSMVNYNYTSLSPMTKGECFKSCFNDTSCHTFAYSGTTETCYRFECGDSCIVTSGTYTIYTRTCHTNDTIQQECTSTQVCINCMANDYSLNIGHGFITETECLRTKSLKYPTIHWYPGTIVSMPICRYFDDSYNTEFDDTPGRWQAWPTCNTDCLLFTLYKHTFANIEGNYTQFPVSNKGECFKTCFDDRNCHVFSYYGVTKTCYINQCDFPCNIVSGVYTIYSRTCHDTETSTTANTMNTTSTSTTTPTMATTLHITTEPTLTTTTMTQAQTMTTTPELTTTSTMTTPATRTTGPTVTTTPTMTTTPPMITTHSSATTVSSHTTRKQRVIKPLYIMPCLCNKSNTFAGLTEKEIISYLVKETAIETKNTSANIYKRRCREDNRPFTTTTGIVAVCVMAGIFGVIFVMDLQNLIRHVRDYGTMFRKSKAPNAIQMTKTTA